MLVWSLAMAVFSHPLKIISSNLRWLEDLFATRRKGWNESAHTHACTRVHDLLLCLSPLEKQPVHHRSHTTVHWFTAMFFFEFVVGFGSAFLDCKCKLHYSICQHLLFLNHHFSWLLFPQCLFHPISFPPEIEIYLPFRCNWLHLFIKLTIPTIRLCILFLCDAAYSRYRLLSLLCVCDWLICCIHLKSKSMYMCVSADSLILSVKTQHSEHSPLWKSEIRAELRVMDIKSHLWCGQQAITIRVVNNI